MHEHVLINHRLFVCPSYVTQNTEVRIDKKHGTCLPEVHSYHITVCSSVWPVVVDDRRERQNLARANSEFFRYLLTLSSKKLRHTHIVLTPACTLCARTSRHSIRCSSSLMHLAFELNAHLPLLVRNSWVFVWRTCSHSTAHVMSWTVLLRALFALSMTSHLRAYCNSGLKHFAVCVVVHSSIVNGRFPAVRLEMVENLKC